MLHFIFNNFRNVNHEYDFIRIIREKKMYLKLTSLLFSFLGAKFAVLEGNFLLMTNYKNNAAYNHIKLP